jgi:hypothetical protein
MALAKASCARPFAAVQGVVHVCLGGAKLLRQTRLRGNGPLGICRGWALRSSLPFAPASHGRPNIQVDVKSVPIWLLQDVEFGARRPRPCTHQENSSRRSRSRSAASPISAMSSHCCASVRYMALSALSPRHPAALATRTHSAALALQAFPSLPMRTFT